MAKVSVIIPIYKVENYLNRCVESVVGQTYSDLEIILVDDGSPDNCPQMCDEWENKDSRIRVIHKQNGGLSDARNAGLDICTGEYITFLDSDDLLSLNFVETLINVAQDTNADIVSCGLKRFYDKIEKEEDNQEIKVYSRDQSLKNAFVKQHNEFIVACAKLYKAEIFKDLRYTKGKIHEDEFIIHKVFDKINTFAVTNLKLYYYYENPQSITGVGYRLKRIDYLEALADRCDFFKEKYPHLYPDMAMYYTYKCIDLYFEIPKDFPQKKLAQKLTKKHFKSAKKQTKAFKHKSGKRFFIFSVSPKLYKRLF